MNVPLPRKLQIEPVGHCNLKCPMCAAPYREKGGAPAFIAPDLFRNVVDSLPGLEELHLQGIGEPLLHPKFFELVQYAVSHGVRVTTSSNLTVLSDGMAERCVESGLDTVHVSIDAADPRVYGRIRVGVNLEQVLANVERLVQARARLGSRSPQLKLVMVLMRCNLAELPAVIRLAADQGFEAVFVQRLSHRFLEPDLPERFMPLQAFTAQESLDDLDPAGLEEVLNGAREIASQLGLEVRLPRARPRSHSAGEARCDWPWTQAYVCFDGSVLPCCMVSTPDRACLGSVGEAGFPDVWRGPAYARFRQRLSSEKPPAICLSCALYWGVF